MGFQLMGVTQAKQKVLRTVPEKYRSWSVPKGHVAVYVGETQKKRLVTPISYLSHHLFQELLKEVEEQFGFDHPTGGLTLPCSRDYFVSLTSALEWHYLLTFFGRPEA